MDPDSGAETQRALSLQWKSFKLVQDPATRRVTQKIYRYDGVHFSVPDSGFPPVGDLRDPRPRRIWSRYTELSLPVPKFKLDEFYVGPIPLKEVTFARLNDNIKEPFLAEMCAKFGEVEEMEILFHPKTRKHLGLARVLFTSTRGAKETVKSLHNTSVMGNIIHAQLDIKGQQRLKYYDLIVNGSYTPQTVPLGGKALAERIQPPAPKQPDTSSDICQRLSTSDLAALAAAAQAPAASCPSSSSSSANTTETGYGEQRALDTPTGSSSAGSGTPYTSRSGTPFSQDSGYAGGRHGSYGGGALSSGYPPQDMLPSSSSSSAVSSSAGGYKVSRYPPEEPQEPPAYHRGRPPPLYGPEPPCYPTYPGPAHHHHMPPPPYEQDREREPAGGSRYGRRASSSSYQEANSSSKYHAPPLAPHHHHHHGDRRDERGHRRDSLGSRPAPSSAAAAEHGHQRHRNHHHRHARHARRRSSHEPARDREAEHGSSLDPRHNSSNSHRSSSNSMSPPCSSSSSSSSKEMAGGVAAPPASLPPPSHHDPPASARGGSSSSLTTPGPPGAPLPPPLPLPVPPPPPPLPPASVMAAAVAETLGALDSPPDREEPWAKPQRRPSTPPGAPTPPPPPPASSPPLSSSSPSSTSLPPLPTPPTSSSALASVVVVAAGAQTPPCRDSSSPEPDSTNESLPFVYHSSSLDSRIEMLLKEQKAKFSFLAFDEEEEEVGAGLRAEEQGNEGGEHEGGGADAAKERAGVAEGDRDRRKGRRVTTGTGRQVKGSDGRKSPPVIAAATPSSSTYSPRGPAPDDPPHGQTGPAAAGPPLEDAPQVSGGEPPSRPSYNGQSQSPPHSSGEDMEISDDEGDAENTITMATPHQPSTPPPSATSPASQAACSGDPPPSSSSSSSNAMPPPPPPMAAYPAHLPPPGYPALPPPPLPPHHHHPDYAPLPHHHLYDYARSAELASQYGMSFQMQTHMLSRLHQLHASSSSPSSTSPSSASPSAAPSSTSSSSALPPANGHAPAVPGDAPPTDYPGSAYHHPHLHPAHLHLHHSMPPPHHPYMDPGDGGGVPYDQDHRYMPPHMPPYTYPPDPHLHHGLWPPHMPPPGYTSYMPPPGYGEGGEGGYGAPGEESAALQAESVPHEATVQMVLATLIQEMKNIMQRDLNRKMVENIAFATFDEWWELKETKAKPFQTMVRGVSALRDEEKREANRPREPLVSLVDWAKSGGVEGFSLRGPLRLPSFKVKRKEPQELQEGDMKIPRPSTPPDEDDEGGRRHETDRRGAERGGKRRKKKPRNRKPWELDSEGEETSDGSSTEKEDDDELEGSEKESDEGAFSDDESLSSSSEGSSTTTSSSSSSSSEDEEKEEGERLDTDEPDSMDESTMDSTVLDSRRNPTAAVSKVKSGDAADGKALAAPAKRPPSPQLPRPPSPVVLVPPLKKRRKTVSFSTEDGDSKAPDAALPSPLPPAIVQPPTPPAATTGGIQLLPFASKPGEGNALIVPPPVRATLPEEPLRRSHALPPPPVPATSARSPGRRPAAKDTPRPPAPPPPPQPIMVCRTVQNLPLDHASMCRIAFEEAPPPPPSPTAPVPTKRPRGRPRAPALPTGEAPCGDEAPEQRPRLREQPGDLSVLADVALATDPDGEGDSEETETSDEAEEQRMEEELFLSAEPLALLMHAEGVAALSEHNYSRPPALLAPVPRRTPLRPDAAVLLPADLNNGISGVLEAPEEVVGEAAIAAAAAALADATAAAKPSRRKGALQLHKDKSKSRRRRSRDKENVEVQKERPGKRKRKLEDSDLEEEVDVEELESGELSSTDSEEDEGVEAVRKSERLFLQEAGVTSAAGRHWRKPVPATTPPPATEPSAPPPLPAVKYELRSEFEQMTILYDIWNSGLDHEDLALLRTTYEKLLQDDHSTDWLNDTHWVGHTVTNLPNPRRKKKNSGAGGNQLREHTTGCARSEGYYAISRKEKDVYLDLDLPEQVLLEAENLDIMGTNRLLSERRSEQRRLLTVIGTPAVMDSDLLKLNQLKFRKKKLRFGRSRIHEWGLFAMEPIAADEMVIEYVGQNIRQMVADNREKRYAQQGIGSSYLFRVDHDTIIDATKCGNLARFINHCCTPNCYAKVITIESQKKIVIYSKQAIAVNDEITYDYKFPLEENKIPCLCGTENCRGTLN